MKYTEGKIWLMSRVLFHIFVFVVFPSCSYNSCGIAHVVCFFLKCVPCVVLTTDTVRVNSGAAQDFLLHE